MKIYVASSWRNYLQAGVVGMLRQMGHEVYDFRHPQPGNEGFHWSAIDPNWKQWTPDEYKAALQHPIAKSGFEFDMKALEQCDACVLVLPCGRSAHLELGYAVGAGKKTYVLLIDQQEPELMALMCTDVLTSTDQLFDVFGGDKFAAFVSPPASEQRSER